MNKYCAFTICAKNYLGLAITLKKSYLSNNKESDFYIFIADEFDEPIQLFSNVLIAKKVLDINSEKWINMSFKYEITEFCTSIKPFCFDYLFRVKEYDKVVYLDPDIYVFSDFTYIYDKLDKYLFITSPHITTPLTPDIESLSETGDRGFLRVGINNFGFVAVKNNAKSLNIIDWWKHKLEIHCFDETMMATFTDQKWMEYLQAFLNNDEYLCSKNKGINFAPWNYFERKVILENNTFYIKNRISPSHSAKDELIFAHFAGYDYKELINGNDRKRIRNQNLKRYKDISLILSNYIEALQKNKSIFNQYINYNYSYNFFNNGNRIDVAQRRIYNSLFNSFNYRRDPFKDGEHSFYQLLKQHKLIDNSSNTKIEKMNPISFKGYSKKIELFYRLMRLFYRTVGYRNYILFLRLMRHMCKYENQTFLLGKNYTNKEII